MSRAPVVAGLVLLVAGLACGGGGANTDACLDLVAHLNDLPCNPVYTEVEEDGFDGLCPGYLDVGACDLEAHFACLKANTVCVDGVLKQSIGQCTPRCR